MTAKVSKRKGKIKIYEKLKEVEEALKETETLLRLIKKEPIDKKEEENGGTGQDLGEADCPRG